MNRPLAVLAALWRKELIALSRDRHGLLALFIMPMAFILIMSMALKDAFSVGATSGLRYTVADLDRSVQSRQLISLLEQGGEFTRAADVGDVTSAKQAVAQGQAAAALVIPPRFGATLVDPASRPLTLRLVTDPALAPAVLQAFRGAILASSCTLSIAEIARRTMLVPGAGNAPAATPPDQAPALEVEAVGGDSQLVQPSAVQQSVPAWLIFSMFFVVIPLSAIFISERREGTLQRLKSQRVSFVMILAGKLLPFCLVNQIQAVLMVLVGIYLVPLAGGDALALPDSWLALWLISLAVSFAAVGWALLVATATRTSEQATVIGGVGNILMGAVGGIMVPKMVMPVAMQPFTALSPMAWALEGFHNVMLRGAGISGIAGPAAALVAFSVFTLAAALVIYWRRAMP